MFYTKWNKEHVSVNFSIKVKVYKDGGQISLQNYYLSIILGMLYQDKQVMRNLSHLYKHKFLLATFQVQLQNADESSLVPNFEYCSFYTINNNNNATLDIKIAVIKLQFVIYSVRGSLSVIIFHLPFL